MTKLDSASSGRFRVVYFWIVLFAALFLLVADVSLVSKNRGLESDLAKENLGEGDFSLLSPTVAQLSVDDFLELQSKYNLRYKPLKEDIVEILEDGEVKGSYGIYFEDLLTGAWVGVDEKIEFIPASLLKVPTLVAVLKKIEEGELRLNQSVELQEDDLNDRSGTLASKGVGYEVTISELVTVLLEESDNTATRTLRRLLTVEEIAQARLSMGLPLLAGYKTSNEPTYLSPKQYSNIFRSLYLSAYLRRPFSQLALSLMAETDFSSGLPAGVPSGVEVSHKVGFWGAEGSFHDCGIIYAGDNTYLLCVMSKGTDEEEADKIISEISRTVYGYVTSSRED